MMGDAYPVADLRAPVRHNHVPHAAALFGASERQIRARSATIPVDPEGEEHGRANARDISLHWAWQAIQVVRGRQAGNAVIAGRNRAELRPKTKMHTAPLPDPMAFQILTQRGLSRTRGSHKNNGMDASAHATRNSRQSWAKPACAFWPRQPDARRLIGQRLDEDIAAKDPEHVEAAEGVQREQAWR